MIIFKQKTMVLLVIFLLISTIAHTAWVDNVPATLTQPDGTIVHAYRSGDEFHNWVHDIEQFTIIQDAETGFWCWAISVDGALVSTGHPVHLETATRLGIPARANISEQKYQEKRKRFDIPSHLNNNSRTPTSGVVNNIVIFVKFADDDDFQTNLSYFDEIFNNSAENANSVYRYYWDASYNQLEVFSHFYPIPNGNTILSYTASHPRSYFQPYNAVTNPNGYMNDLQMVIREQTLIRDIVVAVSNQIPSDIIIDADGDGEVDNLNFVVRGDSGEWVDMLWPHAWTLYYFDVRINGSKVTNFNFNIENFIYRLGASVLAHEFGHSMGFPDFYRYQDLYLTPIGFWDLMSRTTDMPSSVTAYLKYKYTNWVSDIPLITSSGLYTLNPVTTHQNNHAYRINSPHSSSEYFVVEYRNKNTGLIDSTIHGSGLLVYRVFPGPWGNIEGPPDELYVFRLNGTPTENGQVDNAFLSLESGRTEINDFANPFTFLLDGTRGGLNISQIGSAGDTISFYVDLETTVPTLYPPNNISSTLQANSVLLVWQAPLPNSQNLLGYKIYRNNVYIETTDNISFTDNDPKIGSNLYTVTALYENGESMGISSTIYFPPTDAQIVYIGNPESDLISNNPPFDFNRNNSIAQTIYLQNQIDKTGFITSIVYRFYGDNHVPNDVPIKVYLANTNKNGFNTTTDWIDYSDFSLVYEGGLNVAVYEWYDVEIKLDKPFMYNGGNIAIMAYRQWTDEIFREQNKWLNTQTTGTNRSIYFNSNTLMNDIAINFSAGYLSDLVPNTILVFHQEVSEKDYPHSISITNLLNNYPNPFNPQTTISYNLEKSDNVIIDIYNIRGQRVIRLMNDFVEKGSHSIIWDGHDDNGGVVTSGIYLYRMQTSDYVSTKRMVLMK